MPLRLQIVIAALIIFSLIYITNQVKKKNVYLKYVLLWYLVGIVLLILDLFPNLLYGISKAIGIKTPINMLFFFGFILLLGLTFVQTIIISRLSKKAMKLTQDVGLINKKIYELNNKNIDKKE